MSDTHSGTSSETPENIASLGLADWLCLAAAPTFALMALFACIQNGDVAMLCMAANASPLTSMPVMYLLMSAFHLAPWLRVMSGRPVRQ